MSKQTEILEIEKCIQSRLWYTSLIVYQAKNSDKSLSQRSIGDTVDFASSEALIKNLIHPQNAGEYHWIAQVLLNKLIGHASSNINHVQKQFSCIQMAYALQLCKAIPSNARQELLQLYEISSDHKSLEVVKQTSKECFKVLEENIIRNPALICWIINEILHTHFNTASDIVNGIQELYITIIKKSLESQIFEQTVISDDHLGSILCILSKASIIKSKAKEFSELLFPMLLRTCNVTDIELALYTRDDETLFKEWSLFMDETYARSRFINNLDIVLKIRDVIFLYKEDSVIGINTTELLQRITKTKSHWLIDILDICCILLMNEKYDDVSSILSCNLLKHLWPVILLEVLNNFPQEIGCSQIQQDHKSVCALLKFLIHKCDFEASCDSTLRELHIVVNKHIKIMESILSWRKENLTIKDPSETEENNISPEMAEQAIAQAGVSVNDSLFLMQHFNTLTVLKAITNLHEQDYYKVQDLLKDLCEPGNVFQAYSTMLCALKAISLCDSYAVNQKTISNLFSNMKNYLQTLYPLSLRLEVIENIFSLLFLRDEDFNFTEYNFDEDNISTADEKSIFSHLPVDQDLTGFICNKYAIRDMLLYLKDSIFATENECAKRKDEVGYKEETEQIQSSLSTITAAIIDARWRLELYTSSHFIENINNPEDVNHSPGTPITSEILLNGKSTSKGPKENPFFYQVGSASDETNKIKFDSSSESSLIQNSTKRSRRSRNIPLIADTAATRNIYQKQFFINFMLASKESLVIQCLWKNDYARAEEILQMSDMRNAQLNGEVQFSKAMHGFKENIIKLLGTLNDPNLEAGDSQSSILENIRLAAKGGIPSSRQTSQLETFLASQEANLRMLNMDVLNNNEMLTLCVIDLALTIGQIPSTSSNFCDVAMKYLKLCKTFENTEHARFFCNLYQLLYENKDDLAVADLLCDAQIPLSLNKFKERSEFWADVTSRHREFKDTQTNKRTRNETLNYNNHLPGLKALGRMSRIPGGNENYLPNIYTHLQLLHTITPIDDVILTVTDLLKVSLHYYFGHQIFDLGIEPNKLETIALNLQVNLAYSILINACPKLPREEDPRYSNNEKSSGCIVLNKNMSKSDANHTTQGPNRCVSEILTELLQVLQNLNLDRSNVSYASCKAISKHPDLQAVLNKTSRLAGLDLSELSVGDETLTFLINTWNLMFLHTTLTTWAVEQPFNDLQHAVSLTSNGYVIGDLGLVTLAALRSKLLDNVMSDNVFFTQLEELNEPAWQDLDITHDPRVIFVMINEFDNTPRIRIYDSRTLNQDLTTASHEYLDSFEITEQSMQASDKQKTIFLPDLVRRYQNFVTQSRKSIAQGTSDNENSFSIEDHFKLSEETEIRYKPAIRSYNITFAYSSHRNNDHQQKKVHSHKETWNPRTLRPSLLQYLEGHCWILSYLLQRMHNKTPTILENTCYNSKRTACLENLLASTWIAELKTLFDDNQTLAAIPATITKEILWPYFEAALESNAWRPCLELINALPDNILLTNSELQCFKDKILSHMVSEETSSCSEMLQYLYQIKDVHTLAQTVLCNINKWHINVCEYALLHALNHKRSEELPAHCIHRMNETLHRVLIFHKMIPYCKSKSSVTWYDVAYCTERIDPLQIITFLINADQFELCLEWLECQAFSLKMESLTMQDLLIGLVKDECQNFRQALKFLQALPLSQSIKMCKGILKKLESIDALQFVANYLLEYCKATETTKYRITLVGIDILRMIEPKERSLYIHLIQEPLLMLEQLLMNCKFESIQKILNKISERLVHLGISLSSFDKTVKFYAERSLDCHVSLQPDGIENKSKTMQHSISEVENAEFVMPSAVPTKEEWIPNDKARECSCCKTVIFSMFNRRHHCRRCGRVICAVCSKHRMQVIGYPPSVPVRVCDDCKEQTALQLRAMQGTPSTPSSETFDYWRLTNDETHNQTIREEFSFEYAPNISLCLSILNLHSDHKAYTSFLLDRCDEMKNLLQPISGGKVNPEVDHTVIIKMIRSLLVAAKVKCAKLGLNTGLTHCDRCLSQVDLIATLVQSDSLDLIPSDKLGKHTLRKLRDLMIEKEQWTLALDVSTKAGLDTHGVWASWGKACLKMGYFDQARDKYFHCLNKILHEDYDDWVLLSYPKESPNKQETREITSETKNVRNADSLPKADESGLRKAEFTKNRPVKDPPLLTEILQILDNLSAHRQHFQHSHQYKRSATQEILNTFGNLKIASQGQYNVKQASGIAQNIYYQESLYYLLTYGSCNSILEFFLKYEEFDKCLAFALENDLEPEIFFNAIYLHCLKNGTAEGLHEAMKSRDPCLLIWKKYLIHVCHNLERRQYLHILYQLQLFMRDCVRAAMTCIRFYVNEANDYTDLCLRGHFLLDAQKHLESELQIESLGRKSRKSACSIHSSPAILTMEMEPLEIDRHMNTICRQMEIAKFLSNCEKEGRPPVQFLRLFPDIDNEGPSAFELPTLFGNQQQKIHLAVLAILCGRDIEEGFGTAFRIMQDCNLPHQKVYSLAGHVLATKDNIPAIEQLIKCCHTSGAPNSYVISDYVLTHCVKLLLNRVYTESGPMMKNHIDKLVRLITDIELKINAYIECKQLKAAYLLAVKHSRAQDIRKILKESDRLGQNAIKAICIRWLQQEPRK